MSRWFSAGFASLALSFSAFGGNPAPSQVFYVPFPEDNQLAGYVGVNGAAVDPLAVFVNFSASADNTVIYYDHWEDGYETDVTSPKQSSTLVFGDGNPSNGYPPGNAGDLISAGTVFSLRNYVTSTTLQSVVDYDARDKISSFKPISVTKSTFPASTNSLLAGCVEVFEKGIWGTEYRVPVGANMPTATATSTLTWDADIFGYSAISIMAGVGGAIVKIDADNNPITPEQTVTLAEGETSYVAGISVGGRVISDKPVQVVLFTGRPTSSYQSRDTSLLPTNRWSSSYFAPVSTPATYGTSVFLYNPGVSAITVSYDFRRTTSSYTTATVNVPAGGNARVTLAPSNGTSHFGAYKFYTTGAIPPVFYAFCAVDAASSTVGENQAFDGGFTLVGQPSLTTQVLVSLGIGRDPYSSTNLTENGNPVWVTTAGNGHTAETVYIDFNGDNAGSLTDPNGNKYDVAFSLRELEQKKIYDPDGDQSGMLIYVLNPNVKIAAAWAQDPSVAATGQPGLDVSTLIPPLREGDASKGSSIAIDADADGYRSPGDTLEYDIRTINTARSAINGPFTIKDDLPVDLSYIPGSTKYRYSVKGAWQAWVTVPDDGSGTALPLDLSGFSVPGTLGVGQQIQVVFRAAIKTYPNLTPGTTRVTNIGSVIVTPYGITVGLEWTDLIYGSIGDRVWVDANGNGSQDPGENGLNGVSVYADGNNNGVQDLGEPVSVTSGNGDYLLPGLLAGNYIIRVDAASVAALNPGYGPSYDFDGITTSYVANLTLAAGERIAVADFGFREGASLGDRVWFDLNGDGVQEPAEPGINGVRVFIDSNGNGTYQAGETNTITSGDGSYLIGNLSVGTYSVCIDSSTLPAGALQTFDSDGNGTTNKAGVTFIGAQHRADLDFGYRGTLSIGDLVWNDVNGNGILGSEPGIANVRVFIDSNGNGICDVNEAFAITNASGFYSISNLTGGTYSVRVDTGTLPNSMASTYDLTQPTTDSQATVVLSGVSRADVDFGYRNDATIGDRVWNDMDNDGVQDAGEPGTEGVLVYIDSDDDNLFDQGVERFSITNVNGNYSFGNLAVGTYAVRVEISTLPRGSTQTYDLDGLSSAHEVSRNVTVSQDATDVDFGYRSASSAGDFVWVDSDADGFQDSGEPGINGVRVYLDINGNGLFDSISEPSTFTASGGVYVLSGLVSGTYTARVDVSTLPAGMISTYDLSGGLDNAATFMLNPSQIRADLDFGYTQPVSIGDRVWNDSNANGVFDVGEAGLDGVSVTLYNATTATIAGTAITVGGGNYTFGNQLPGTYFVEFAALSGYSRTRVDVGLDTSDSDANLLTGRTANVTLTSGQSNTTLDAGYCMFGSISGTVFADTNDDRNGDVPLEGVVIQLLDRLGSPILNSGGVTTTTTTVADGTYAFRNLPSGQYGVRQVQPSNYGSVSDTDGPNDNVIGILNPITVAPGTNSGGNNFIEIEFGAISGFVHAGSSPLAGVVMTLLDRFGNPVDGDPATPGVQPVTTTTGSLGYYQFSGIVPGTYQVSQNQPFGYNSVGDADGGDVNIIGDKSTIVVAPGQHRETNNFLEAIDTCPDDWAQWKFQHPGELANGNPDSDAYDNFAEFAFAMPADTGTGSPWLLNPAWMIRPSGIAPDTLEGVFVRPKGAPLNVTYTLQYAASLGNPTTWLSKVVTPSLISQVDNLDCTETVTIHDLEGITDLKDGKGVVRIKAELDEVPTSGTDRTSYSEVEGWKETPLELCCRTYNNPFLRESVFTGQVSGVAGQAVSFAISASGVNLATLSGSGGAFYLEVTSGDNEGHRFDIVSASGNSVTLANDNHLFAGGAPFNTLTDVLPASLANDQVVIRRHWTLNEVFPVSGFGATGSQSDADQVQVFADGAWTIYWLYDLGDGNPATARWVSAADSGMADQGGAVIPPGQGMFLFNRTSVTSILAYGEIRPNAFVRPLNNGSNFVAGGYPVDQSIDGLNGRAMNLTQGFFGGLDFKAADSVFVWKADATMNAAGYDTFYLLSGAPARPALLRWVKVGDASALARDFEILLYGNRSAFVRAKTKLDNYKIPSPWSP